MDNRILLYLSKSCSLDLFRKDHRVVQVDFMNDIVRNFNNPDTGYPDITGYNRIWETNYLLTDVFSRVRPALTDLFIVGSMNPAEIKCMFKH